MGIYFKPETVPELCAEHGLIAPDAGDARELGPEGAIGLILRAGRTERPARVFHLRHELASPPVGPGRSGRAGRPDRRLRRRFRLVADSTAAAARAARSAGGERAGEAGEGRRLRPARLHHRAARQSPICTWWSGREPCESCGTVRWSRLPRSTSPIRSTPTARSRACSPSPSRRTSRTSRLVYAYYTGNGPGPARGRLHGRRRRLIRPIERSASFCTWTTSPPTTTAACSSSARTGELYIGTGDGGHRRRSEAKRPERRLAARQDPPNRPTAERGRPYTVPRPVPLGAGRPSRDLRLRPAEPVALQLRSEHGLPADRRRRAEHPGGGRLRPGGARLRQQLRLVGL